MADVQYTKLPQSELVEEPVLPKYEEHAYPPSASSPTVFVIPVEAEKEAPTHCGSSVFATLCCCLPAGLAGLFFSIQTHVANRAGNTAAAKRFSDLAKKCVKVSIVFGVLFLVVSTVLHIGAFGHEMHRAKMAFRGGWRAGIDEGRLAGGQQALELLKNSQTAVLPNPIPLNGNPFDVRKDNPFWQEIEEAGEQGPAQIAQVFGYHFGLTHGYKLGFCNTPGADCSSIELRNTTCPFRALFGDRFQRPRWWKGQGRHHDEKHEHHRHEHRHYDDEAEKADD
eukprot:comp22595_c0_seq1/m.34627 comp22595_c0_seq1/g.34627  ORF comp22595_c0_seq1/g.34627 comp22595_c0_seq1/m.34627 type:complete len:281 (-) comp22595_c0_seq1:852-1694(-)